MKKKKKKGRERGRDERERKERAKREQEPRRSRETYRWKAGCDGGGGVPKFSAEPCRNRCI